MPEKIIREYPNSFNLPKRIEGLGTIAHNLWWVWHQDGQRLFQYIDPLLWDRLNHNAIAFLQQVERTRINAAVDQPGYLEFYDATLASMTAYLSSQETWFHRTYPNLLDKTIVSSTDTNGVLNYEVGRQFMLEVGYKF